jgi:hypothetical protein
MNKKFDKFETLCEKARTHYSNGGFRTNTPVKIRPEFLNSEFYKAHYQPKGVFDTWLRGCMKENPDMFFFIHDIASPSTNGSAKDANDLAGGANNIILTLKVDPRTISTPTEFNEFNVPGDYRYIEVLDYGINLPPVQGVPNKYEHYKDYVQVSPKPVDVDDYKDLNNHALDAKLPQKNTAIKASVAKEKKYFNGPKRSKNFLAGKKPKKK